MCRPTAAGGFNSGLGIGIALVSPKAGPGTATDRLESSSSMTLMPPSVIDRRSPFRSRTLMQSSDEPRMPRRNSASLRISSASRRCSVLSRKMFTEPDVHVILGPQRHHLAIGPKARTVFFQVPAFVSRSSLRQRAAHFDPSAICGLIFRCEEAIRRLTAKFPLAVHPKMRSAPIFQSVINPAVPRPMMAKSIALSKIA